MERGETLVIGVGEVGGALAEVLERHGRVIRLDIEPRQIDEPIGVMHVCIPFKNKQQFEAIAADYVRRFKPELTIINSTVLPGTTRALANATGAAVAYSPVRGKHFRMPQDLLRYNKFVAAPDGDTAQKAEDHFRQAGMKTRRLGRPETLELAKLGETTYFGMLIGYAQELNRYANRVGGDYFEATSFFEEVEFLPNWRYFPGFIGGHCVMPNIRLLQQVAPSSLLEALAESNERRALELRSEAIQAEASVGKP